MKFKFIYSKKGYGKTSYIFNDIKNSDDSNIVIFVPSHHTFMVENRLIDFFGEEIFSRVEVMDFKKLTSRLLYIYKKYKNNIVTDIGKNLIINYILRNSEDIRYFNTNNKLSFSDDILSVLIDFKTYNFTDSMIDKVLNELDENSSLYRKLYDFKIINNVYEEYLKGKYLDPLDEMVIINSIIKENPHMFLNYKFYIDGFDILTYHQYEFLKIIFSRVKEINLSLTYDVNSTSPIYTHTKTIRNKILSILDESGCYEIEEISIDDVNKNIELKHLDNNYLNYKVVPYNKEPENIYINKCLNNFNEVEELCKNIRNIIKDKGYRYKDIGILCRDIDSYENFIRVTFDEFNIPYFIDKKNGIKSNIFVIYLTSIFEIFNFNFSFSSIFKYAKSGLINLTNEDIFLIENFALENGITGYKWKQDFEKNTKIKYSMNNFNDNFEETLKKANKIRNELITPLVNLFKKVNKNNTANYFITQLYDFITSNFVLDKLLNICNEFIDKGNFIEADELNQTVNNIFTLFDEVNNIFKDEIISFSDFGEILIDLISKIELSHVPMRLDEIIIGDVSRLMIGNYKALFIIGCTAQNFPKTYKKEELLSDADKIYLKKRGIELSGTNRDKNLSEKYLMYSIINIPKEYMYISYPISDMDSNSLTSSIMISKIKKIFVKLVENHFNIGFTNFSYKDIYSEKSTLNNILILLKDKFNECKDNKLVLDLFKYYKENETYKEHINIFIDQIKYKSNKKNLNENLLSYLYKEGKFSVSSIETYSKCSYKHYLDYIVKVKKRKKYMFEPLDYGNFVHYLMENICKVLKENYEIKNVTLNEVKKLVDEYFNQKVYCNENSNYILNSNYKFKVFGNKIKNIVNDTIYILCKHLYNSEFYHKFYEFEIGSKGSTIEIETFMGNKVEFIGKIDRVDFCKYKGDTYVNIIDYKSSNRSFDYGMIYKNLNIQMIAYMKYLIDFYKNNYDSEIIPCGIFYFIVHRPIIKEKNVVDINKEIEKKYRYDGIFSSDVNKLSLIDKNILENSSNIIPIKFNKSGEISKVGNTLEKILNDKEFSMLLNFVHDSIKNKIEKILKGNFEVKPILENQSCTKCSNCEYLSICKFSKKKNSFNIIDELNKEKFFELLEKGI